MDDWLRLSWTLSIQYNLVSMDPMFRSIQALMDPNFRLKIKCREGHKLRKQLEYWTIEADRQDPVHNKTTTHDHISVLKLC